MRKLLVFALFLISYGVARADTLNLVFRLYDIHGYVVPSTKTSVKLADGNCVQRPSDKNDAWQNWTLFPSTHPINLHISYGSDSFELEIDVHPKFRNGAVQTIVVKRLQNRSRKAILKINELTAVWTAGIVYALEYPFMNPMDMHKLRYRSNTCSPMDSAAVTLDVLSDSVMLLTCGKNAAVFFKYRVDKNGYLTTVPSGFQCTEFNNEVERALYRQLSTPNGRLKVVYENNEVRLVSDVGCEWRFAF